jgi:hypothetical protein
MSAAHPSANSALLGNAERISVSRALSELQARRPIRISASGESLLTLPVDGLDQQRLDAFAVLCSPNTPKLVVTEQRARSIGRSVRDLPYPAEVFPTVFYILPFWSAARAYACLQVKPTETSR